MNVLTFTGNLGRDAELRYTNNRKPVCSFSVAMNSGWGDRKQTTWVACTIWGPRGENLADKLRKGTKVAISGEASLREYQSQGQTRQSLDCNVREVTLLGSDQAPPAQGGASAQDYRDAKGGSAHPQPPAQGGAQADIDDDIPF